MKKGDLTLLVGFRIHCDYEMSLLEFYINNCIKWVEYRGHEILKCVAGYHKDTGNGHMHLHLITKGHKWSNPFQTFKQDFNSGNIGLEYNNEKGLKELPNNILGQKYRNRSNISIKMVVAATETDTIRFLQYPLKEGRKLWAHKVSDVEIDELTKVAKIEYAQAKAKRIEIMNKEESRLTEWETLVKMVQKQNLGSETAVFSYVCEIYKARDTKPPSIRSIVDISERICMKLGILSVYDLSLKYYR